MARREAGRSLSEAIVRMDGDCEVALPTWVRNNMPALRWLHHRVVDLMAKHGHADLMVQDVEDRLAVLSCDMVDDTVNDLIREARDAEEEVARG